MAKAKKNKLSDLNGDIEQIAKMILSQNSKAPKEIKEELEVIIKPMLNPNSKKISKTTNLYPKNLFGKHLKQHQAKAKN